MTSSRDDHTEPLKASTKTLEPGSERQRVRWNPEDSRERLHRIAAREFITRTGGENPSQTDKALQHNEPTPPNRKMAGGEGETYSEPSMLPERMNCRGQLIGSKVRPSRRATAMKSTDSVIGIPWR